MEEINVIDIIELVNSWEKLQFEVTKNNKFDFEFFSATFAKTYSVLSECATEPYVDKKYIPLVSAAYLFSNSKCKELDSKYLAALALTERLINSCAFNSSSSVPKGSMIYIFEMRKDVFIDFTDINDSISKLEKLFEEEYWKSL